MILQHILVIQLCSFNPCWGKKKKKQGKKKRNDDSDKHFHNKLIQPGIYSHHRHPSQTPQC